MSAFSQDLNPSFKTCSDTESIARPPDFPAGPDLEQDGGEAVHDWKSHVLIVVEMEYMLSLEVWCNCLHALEKEGSCSVVTGAFQQSMLEAVLGVHIAQVTCWVGDVGHIHANSLSLVGRMLWNNCQRNDKSSEGSPGVTARCHIISQFLSGKLSSALEGLKISVPLLSTM